MTTKVTTILEDIRRRGETGTTSMEASFRTSMDINSYTGRRTELHQRGAIERLTEKRDGQHVYVLPEFVAGRPTSPYVPHRRRPGPEVRDAHERLTAWFTTIPRTAPPLDDMRTILDHLDTEL